MRSSAAIRDDVRAALAAHGITCTDVFTYGGNTFALCASSREQYDRTLSPGTYLDTLTADDWRSDLPRFVAHYLRNQGAVQ